MTNDKYTNRDLVKHLSDLIGEIAGLGGIVHPTTSWENIPVLKIRQEATAAIQRCQDRVLMIGDILQEMMCRIEHLEEVLDDPIAAYRHRKETLDRIKDGTLDDEESPMQT